MGRYYDNAKIACSKYEEAIVKISQLKSTYSECIALSGKISGVEEIKRLKSSLNIKIEELDSAISKINAIENNLKTKARKLDEAERREIEAREQAEERRRVLQAKKAERL